MGEPIDDLNQISWLLWGDADHQEKASELIAWSVHTKTSEMAEKQTETHVALHNEERDNRDNEPKKSLQKFKKK